LFDGSCDGRHGEGLGSLGRSSSELSELIKEGLVGDRVFGQVGSLGHYLDYVVSAVDSIKSRIRTRLDGVFTLGGLSGKHDTVSTVEDGVGDIRDLGSGRSGVVLIVRERLQLDLAREHTVMDCLCQLDSFAKGWDSPPTFAWHR